MEWGRTTYTYEGPSSSDEAACSNCSTMKRHGIGARDIV